MILSYNVSLYMHFFSLRKWFFSFDATYFKLLGSSPQTPTGVLPLDPALGDSQTQGGI